MIDSITLLRAEEAGLPAAESHPDPPLVCFPMPSEWRKLNPEPSFLLWPAPLVDGHEVAPDYLGKAAVVSLARLAAPHGWRLRVTHAQGSWPSLGQKPGLPRHSLAVRMWRGDQRAVAVYVEGSDAWSWGALYRWRTDSFPALYGQIGPWADAMFGPLCKPSWPTDWSCPSFGPVHGPKRPPKR